MLRLRVGFEGGELIGPEGLHRIEPRAQRDEALRPQAIDAQARILALLLVAGCDLDQPAHPQHAQVAAHGGIAHCAGAGKLASAAGALAEQLHDMAASGLGKGGKGGVEIVNHMRKY